MFTPFGFPFTPTCRSNTRARIGVIQTSPPLNWCIIARSLSITHLSCSYTCFSKTRRDPWTVQDLLFFFIIIIYHIYYIPYLLCTLFIICYIPYLLYVIYHIYYIPYLLCTLFIICYIPYLLYVIYHFYYIPYLYSTFFIHWNTFKSALQF